MHISGSGPLGVLLMIAPLAAIPVFAIVGVPHFAPVVASGADDDDFAELNETGRRPPATSAPLPAPTRSANDLYAPVNEPPRSAGANASTDQERRPSSSTAAAGRSRGSGRWLPPSAALDQWEVRTDVADTAPPSRKNESADSSSGTIADGFEGLEIPTDEEVDDGQVSAEGFNPDLLRADRASQSKKGARSAVDAPLELPSEAEQSGWKDAARRLKKLGIRKYRLESQIDEQKFVFICTFASPDNPRVVRRFEADADNPLEAVQQVLEQIDEWRNRDGAAGQTALLLDDEN